MDVYIHLYLLIVLRFPSTNSEHHIIVFFFFLTLLGPSGRLHNCKSSIIIKSTYRSAICFPNFLATFLIRISSFNFLKTEMFPFKLSSIRGLKFDEISIIPHFPRYSWIWFIVKFRKICAHLLLKRNCIMKLCVF